jgi:hypothetical protein
MIKVSVKKSKRQIFRDGGSTSPVAQKGCEWNLRGIFVPVDEPL